MRLQIYYALLLMLMTQLYVYYVGLQSKFRILRNVNDSNVFVPRIVIQLCNVNQQTAIFKLMF